MSARVLKFTGNWEGRFEPNDNTMKAQENALSDARNIIAARREADNWMSTLLLAMLTTMVEKQRTLLELTLARRDGEDFQQALAVVRLAYSCKEHRLRVSCAIDVLLERECIYWPPAPMRRSPQR